MKAADDFLETISRSIERLMRHRPCGRLPLLERCSTCRDIMALGRLRDSLVQSAKAGGHVIQNARAEHLEANAQRSTVLEILDLFGLPGHDWEAVSLIRAAVAELRADALRVGTLEWLIEYDPDVTIARGASGYPVYVSADHGFGAGAATLREALDLVEARRRAQVSAR